MTTYLLSELSQSATLVAWRQWRESAIEPVDVTSGELPCAPYLLGAAEGGELVGEFPHIRVLFHGERSAEGRPVWRFTGQVRTAELPTSRADLVSRLGERCIDVDEPQTDGETVTLTARFRPD